MKTAKVDIETEKAEIKQQLVSEERALNSLIGFREEFIPSSDDVKPASFHEDWSKILLTGTGNFAIEAFRESAKTQIAIRANLLHALTYPQKHRNYSVIICATQTTASKKLQEVSREFLVNGAMNGLVQEVKDNSGLALEVHYKTVEKVRTAINFVSGNFFMHVMIYS